MKEKINERFPKSINFPIELSLLCDWVDKNGYPISGSFRLRANEYDLIDSWFGVDGADEDLALFGAGGDGSLYCIWNHKSGKKPVVHLGSEGDRILVLADHMVGFLVLLAIGYDEIGFDNLDAEPSEPNPKFQDWVKSQFRVSIPERGKKLIESTEITDSELKQWVESFKIL